MFRHYLFPELDGVGRLIAIDLPGYDDTPPLDGRHTVDAYAGLIPALLDALEIESCHLVGVSMGACIVLKAGVLSGQRVRSICASGGVVWAKRRFPASFRATSIAALKPVTVLPGALLRRITNDLLARRSLVNLIGRLTNPVDLALLGQAYPDIAVHAIRSSSPRIWAENIIDVLRIDLRDELSQLTVPVLVADGEHVHLKAMRTAWEVLSHIPDPIQHVAIIPGCGHLAPYSNPVAFAAALRPFYHQVGL